MEMMEAEGLTRVVIVRKVQDIGSEEPAVQEFWADSWDISIQDDNKTVKFYGQGSGAGARKQRSDAFAADVANAERNLFVKEQIKKPEPTYFESHAYIDMDGVCLTCEGPSSGEWHF